MHQHVLAKTSLQSPILAHSSWSISQKPAELPIIFIGGVHGDEPEGVWLAKHTLNWLQSQPADTTKPWVLVECLNVDGYKAGTRVNSQGIDLNRNFPSPDWSQESKSSRYHPGTHPCSAPEVKGLVDLLKRLPSSLIVHAHSWEPCLIVTGPSSNRIKSFAGITGYDLKSDIGYATPGSLGSYGWQVLRTPVLCIEEREGCSEAETWARFENAIPLLFLTDPELRSRGLLS